MAKFLKIYKNPNSKAQSMNKKSKSTLGSNAKELMIKASIACNKKQINDNLNSIHYHYDQQIRQLDQQINFQEKPNIE